MADDNYYITDDNYYIRDDDNSNDNGNRAIFFKYYLEQGVFASYLSCFAGIVLILSVIDVCLTRPRFKLGNVLSTAAYDNYNNHHRHSSLDGLSCLVNNNSNNKDRPNSAKNSNGLINQLTSTYNNNSFGNNNVTGNYNDDDETYISLTTSCCLSLCCIDFNRANKYHQIFSYEFKRDVLLGYNSKVYNGIGNIVFKNGSLCGRSYFKFQQGFLEDFIFHMINFNLFLSTIFADIQSPYTRMHRRIVFFCQSVLAFSLQLGLVFLSVIASQHYDEGDYASYTTYKFFSDDTFVFVITVFVISPLVILINRLMYYLFVCPCLAPSIEIPRIGSKNDSIDGSSILAEEEKDSSIRSKKSLTTIAKFCGQSAAFPLILVSLALMWLCSLLTSNLAYIINPYDHEGLTYDDEVSYTLQTIANYAWSILVISNVEDFLFRFFYFFAGVYTIRFRIHKWFILSLGVWQIEERISEMEEEVVAVKNRSSDSDLTTNNMAPGDINKMLGDSFHYTEYRLSIFSICVWKNSEIKGLLDSVVEKGSVTLNTMFSNGNDTIISSSTKTTTSGSSSTKNNSIGAAEKGIGVMRID